MGVVSRVLHPGSSKLLKYHVPIPLDWLIMLYDSYVNNDPPRSVVNALRWSRSPNGGRPSYWSRNPRVSEMTFDVSESGTLLSPNGATQSTRSFPFGKTSITCSEDIRRYFYGHIESIQSIECATPHGDFRAHFLGDSADVPDFYRTLQLVRQTD